MILLIILLPNVCRSLCIELLTEGIIERKTSPKVQAVLWTRASLAR